MFFNLSNLDQNSIVVTPNNRLADSLRQEFDRENTRLKNLAWLTPKIFPLRIFLINIWQNCANAKILLNESQELELWKQVVSEISLAKLARNAFELIHAWRLDKTQINSFEFKNWLKKFQQICFARDFITESELPDILLLSIPDLKKFLPKKILAVGFAEQTPQMKSFFQTLKAHGIEYAELDPNNLSSSPSRISFLNQEQEIYTMARFAKEKLIKNPHANIGCVVPKMLELRPKVRRIFQDVFGDTPFNMSAGEKFSEYFIVKAALLFLKLADPISVSDLSAFLLSPCCGLSANSIIFEEKIRLKAKSAFSLHELKTLATQDPLLINLIEKLQNYFNQCRAPNLPSKWANIFAQTLIALGWPGIKKLTSLNFQVLERFKNLLAEFAKLDLVVSKISHVEAIEILTSLTENTIFQPKAQEAKVNVLGLLEASSINFDYLWIMGMDHESWPLVSKPNPLLPLSLQKQNNLLHASQENELEFSLNLTDRFVRSCHNELIFSFTAKISDRELEASPLIEKFPETILEKFALAEFTPRAKKIFLARELETYVDDFAPKVLTHEKTFGGSKVFTLQSLCPFRAFAEFRLDAKELALDEFKFNKKDRGTIIHQALDQIWQDLKNQKELLRISDIELKEMIQHVLNTILTKKYAHKLSHFLDLEKECLTKLILSWFEQEKKRPPFQVAATEKTLAISIANLNSQLRIDRIDNLLDGKQMIIDYKTGATLPKTKDCFADRPKDLQLALYCFAVENAKSFSYGQINARAIKLATLDEKDFYTIFASNTTETKINWQTFTARWRSILETLATEFLSGKAAVEPQDKFVCDNCKLAILCRIKLEQNFTDEEKVDADS
ncbi:MAG: PD-(D/E)XK nuclease family protein [Gammaproteobacteria bacterium]|nr:PD-(D/E)XK nuclease family protein [Gammaproteobacteria bacterium]